jgi:hypothetical protein
MNLSEILKEKQNKRWGYLQRMRNLESERENIVRKFNKEYINLLKIVKTQYGLRCATNESSKMKKYQKELNENKVFRRECTRKLISLKRALKTLNDVNSKLTK